MPSILIKGLVLLLCLSSQWLYAAGASDEARDEKIKQSRSVVEELKAPLYNPFVERYVLDDLKQLRTELAAQKAEIIQQIVDREHNSVDRAVTYATNTVTYFFYLIAAATSILVIVGWTSIRDIKERVHSQADEEISRLVGEYERRLHAIESQLNQKTQDIEDNREEIELTQERQSLWLRAARENNFHNKIAVYDQILKLRRDDTEALTYKADAVLELNEPQWAINLCYQALAIDPENSHAFYQLACAYTVLGMQEEAVNCVAEVLERTDTYKEDILSDPVMKPLHENERFKELMGEDALNQTEDAV
ncbi:MAG: tetratricopeptide (TPR) repeat protein [Bermanella sp.]|jgi:tetratricopeptide (TPR) repeat protein